MPKGKYTSNADFQSLVDMVDVPKQFQWPSLWNKASIFGIGPNLLRQLGSFISLLRLQVTLKGNPTL